MPFPILVGVAGHHLMVLASLGAALVLGALLLMAMSGGLAFFGGWRRSRRLVVSARTLFYGAAAAVVAASAVLVTALLTHDFSLAFVTEHTDRSLPPALLAAAFYGGQEGSLLYWTLLLGLLGSASLASARGADPRLAAYANGVLALVAGFFLVVLAFVASPFDVLRVTPADGLGLNPVLRDGGMLIHPPFLLAGFSSFAIPFAFAMATLLSGESEGSWVARTRTFALLSWSLQSVGLTLGMWWAYHVLGWGGYWGWDPVENVALMPWLLTTAFIHSAQVQERRARLHAWNLGLVIGAFILSVFGTFIVRSGILPSVHTFALSPLGPWFLGFLAASVLASGAVLAWRAPLLATREPVAQPTVSREGAFLLQNILLVALTAAVLWGTLLPLLSGMVGRQLLVGPAYYERVGVPLLVALLALLAVAPPLPWRNAGRRWLGHLRPPLAAAALTLLVLLLAGAGPGALVALPLIAAGLATALGDYVRAALRARRLPGPWPAAAARLAQRRRRRYGAFLAHVGILMVAAGIVGSHIWQQQRDVTLQPGASATIAGRVLSLDGVDQQTVADHSETVARLHLGDQTLEPARLNYPSQGGQAVTRVAIRSTAVEDLYVVLAGTSPDGSASFHVFVNPLVTWIWAGAALLVVGVLLGHLGRPVRQEQTAPVAARIPVLAR